ncbi:MAG: OB-fold domain-containing protein [Actinobacteria bacterium]|nr:OB-fold domain-containing protein [Actinomycetota bacterium]
MTTAVREGMFTLDDRPHLIGGRCDDCGRHHFPVLTTCPYCSSERIERAELSDHGTLWGWTAVTAPPPGYQGEVPFGFGVVELPEGLRVITRLSYPVERFTFGMPMRLRVVALKADDPGNGGNEVVTYEFTPEDGP